MGNATFVKILLPLNIMSAKKRARGKKTLKPEGKKSKESDTEPDDKGSERFDFGGIPDRSLKKSLGC